MHQEISTTAMISASGRWCYLSADPIGLAGGMNLYAYVGGDPVNWIDPMGLAMADLFKDGIVNIYPRSKKTRVFDGNTLDTIEKRQKYYQPQIENRVKTLAAQMNVAIQVPFPPGHPISSIIQYLEFRTSHRHPLATVTL